MIGEGEVGAASAVRTVPGTVQVVSRRPIEIRADDDGGQGSFAGHIEERPWLVAAALLGLFAVLLAGVRHRR